MKSNWIVSFLIALILLFSIGCGTSPNHQIQARKFKLKLLEPNQKNWQ